MDENTPSPDQKPGEITRLRSLSRGPVRARSLNTRYSAFIRSMRIVLPLFALGIIAALFSWNTLQPDQIAPIAAEKAAPTIGKNELLNPRFDSVDDKNQPYTITAERALQGENDGLMVLDNPMADVALNSGNWMAIKSEQGAFRQESQRLLLKSNVELFHDDGYTMKTQELDVDLEAGTARSDVKVDAHGPMGTIEASGLQADSKAETLIFTGPATLVLYDAGGSEEIFNP